MQIKFDLKDINDLTELSKVINLKEIIDFSGITLNGRKLNKDNVSQLRKNIMNSYMANSNYGKTVMDNLDNIIEKKEAIYIKIEDIYSAPKKWNFYDQLDDNKKLELMESIEENGILSPIIVWKIDYESVESEYENDEVDVYDFQGSKYLILAGHNRSDAFNKLYSATKDDKYLKIPAFIFETKELTLETARRIVVDTNYVQRVLSTKETVNSVMYKYAEVSENKTKKGKVRDIVAEELGISPTTVYNYIKLSTIIKPFQEMVYNDELTLTSVLKIVNLSADDQQWLYDKYKEVINSKILSKIKPSMDRDDIYRVIEKALEVKTSPVKEISFEIPEHLENKARKLIANLLERERKKSKKVSG